MQWNDIEYSLTFYYVVTKSSNVFCAEHYNNYMKQNNYVSN